MLALTIMGNVPLALIGKRSRAVDHGAAPSREIAIGFITVTGIVARYGILEPSTWLHG